MLLTLGKGIFLDQKRRCFFCTGFITTSLSGNQVKRQTNLQNDTAKNHNFKRLNESQTCLKANKQAILGSFKKQDRIFLNPM